MKVQLLYFDGCPNWEIMLSTLREFLGEKSPPVAVDLVRVDTQKTAERWSFRGSPTVLIDGEDPFLDSDAPIGLSCRIYRTPAGLAGSPSREQLEEIAGRGGP